MCLLASLGLLLAVLVLAITSFVKPLWGILPVADDQFVNFIILRERMMIAVQSVSNPKAILIHKRQFEHSMGRAPRNSASNLPFSIDWRLSFRLPLQPLPPLTRDSNENMPPTYYTLTITQVIFPLWVPALLLLAYPAVAFIRERLRIRRRRMRGHCQWCGYDLTGNVSGICPECGTPIPDEVREQLTTDLPKQ